MEHHHSLEDSNLSCRSSHKLAISHEGSLSEHQKSKGSIESTYLHHLYFFIMDYSGKIVVITGASSGIGKESALEFAKLRASIVLVSRDKSKLEEVAKELSEYQTQILVYA